MSADLQDIAAKLIARGKGILAADGHRERLKDYLWDGCQVAGRSPCHERATECCVRKCKRARSRTTRCALPEAEPCADRRAEVLLDGTHTIERCDQVTGLVLQAVCNSLCEQAVSLEAMLLKPNMVIAGKESPRQASTPEVATTTLRCLRRHVPAAVPGIVFLSGGQEDRVATANLNAINQLPGPKPWAISFSNGRALQDGALKAWHGRNENLAAGQHAFYHRARCNAAASLGTYDPELDARPDGNPTHRHSWHDD